MTPEDAFLVGASITIGVTAIALIKKAEECDKISRRLLVEYKTLNYNVLGACELIKEGNKEIEEGNKILRDLIKLSLEENTTNSRRRYNR